MILLVSVVYDFWTGPRVSELIKQDLQSPERRKYHGAADVVVLLAVLLVRESF